MQKIFLFTIGFIALFAWHQAASQANKNQTSPVVHIAKLGTNGYTSGKLSWRVVDSILQLKINVTDQKTGKTIPASAFAFYYAERGLFEDSTGRPKIMTEYYTLNLEGDSIPRYMTRGYKDKAKRGDTIKFYNILAKSDSVFIKGEDINLILE